MTVQLVITIITVIVGPLLVYILKLAADHVVTKKQQEVDRKKEEQNEQQDQADTISKEAKQNQSIDAQKNARDEWEKSH